MSDFVVERRSNVPAAAFFNDYYRANRPVILTGAMDGWPAMTRWDNPAYLQQACGDETVQIMCSRDGDDQYETRCDKARTTLTFRDYVAKVFAAGETNDFYMVAQNEFMRTPGAKRLYGDISGFPDYLNDLRDGYIFMWFGPAGTVTPLHYDTTNIILSQVLGRKRITLLPANQTALVYNHIGVFGKVDCERPDLIRYPLYRYARKAVFELCPGEALFIPVGWWHHVRALDPSMSVSFTNFRDQAP